MGVARWLSVACGPVKGRFARAGRCFVQCREQYNEYRDIKRRGAVIKSGAWFGTRSRYWRERGVGGERKRGSCCEDKWLLDMSGVPT